MKKFLILMIGLLFVITLQAQTSGTTYGLASSVTSSTAFNLSKVTFWRGTQLKDSISGTASKNWVFDIAKGNLYYYQVVCSYDTVLRGHRVLGNHVIVALSGSVDGVYYTQIDSILYHPTSRYVTGGDYGAIRSVKMKDVSTGVLWRYLRVTATGQDANKCAIISKLMVKVGIRY